LKLRIPGILLIILAANLLGVSCNSQTATTVSSVPTTSSTTPKTSATVVTTPTVTTTTTGPSVTTTTTTAPSTTARPTTPIPPSQLGGGVYAFTMWGYVTERSKDAAAFDQKYQDSKFQITGKVTGINNAGGFVIVDDGSLPPGYASSPTWYCYQLDQFNNLKQGQTVTLRGYWGSQGQGVNAGDPVNLGLCQLVTAP
jgi:hypothetical protein